MPQLLDAASAPTAYTEIAVEQDVAAQSTRLNLHAISRFYYFTVGFFVQPD